MSGMLGLVATNMAIALTVEGAVDEGKLREHFKQAFRNVLRLVLPVVLIVFVGADRLLGFFGSAYARHGSTLLRLLVLASIPQTFVYLKVGVYRAQRRVRPVILVHATIAALMLGLSAALLSRYGIRSVGLAWLLAQMTVASCILLQESRSPQRATVWSSSETAARSRARSVSPSSPEVTEVTE
jgi:O-antigen/teichoic acid export membrane protein